MQNSKAFTMVELVFVIVVIGILSAIAIPKLAGTVDLAYMVKGKNTLASVRSAITTERQKRILRGDFDPIEDLGDETHAFNKFKEGSKSELLAFPEKNCDTGQTGCWSRQSATTYVYKFADSADGDAKFKLENNKLVCDNDNADCAQILN